MQHERKPKIKLNPSSPCNARKNVRGSNRRKRRLLNAMLAFRQSPRREHRQNQHATLRASKPYATFAVSPRAQPGGVPRPAGKKEDSKGGRKPAMKGFSSPFGTPLVTFVMCNPRINACKSNCPRGTSASLRKKDALPRQRRKTKPFHQRRAAGNARRKVRGRNRRKATVA